MRTYGAGMLSRWLYRIVLVVAPIAHATQAFAAQPVIAPPTPQPIAYQIDRGTLENALQQWARQSGLVLLLDATEISDLRSPAVDATLLPTDALQRLVAKLPVKAMQTSPGVFVVRRHYERIVRPPLPMRSAPPSSEADVELAPVHVRGSRLQRTLLQTTLPKTVIERDDIVRSGYGSLFDFLRHLPGMSGYPSLAMSRDGDSLYLPVGEAITTSLDGLGPRATLFLVNGRRLPRYPMVSLQQGALTDLSGIPLSFVERIELVRGGASAIYGADAMSGVVNIILRESAVGQELLIQSGLSSREDGDQHRLHWANGDVRDNGDRWFAGVDLQRTQHVSSDRRSWHRDDVRYPIGLIVDGRYLPAILCEPPLQSDDEGCWYDKSRPRSLQPGAVNAAAYARYKHYLDEGRYAFAEARVNQNRQRFELGATAATLRFGKGLLLNHVFQERGSVRTRVRTIEADVTVGVGRNQPERSWEAGISGQRSKESLSTVGAVHTQRLIEAIRQNFLPGFTTQRSQLSEQLFPSMNNRGRTDQWQAWWGTQRDLMQLPGGAAQLASGIDLRYESWTMHPDALLDEGELALGLPVEQRRLSRPSSAVYAELGLPLADSVRLDLATRTDHYAGDDSLSPRAGLRWNPSPHWSLLLSIGRGYRAPSLFERRRPPAYFGTIVLPPSPALPACAEPSPSGCVLDVKVVENILLKPETTLSYSFGVTWSPTLPVSVSLTHNIIDLRNEILALQPGDAVWNPNIWRLSSNGLLQTLKLSFDNVGRTVSRSWVLRANYHHQTLAHGQWRFSLDALQQQLRRFRRQDEPLDLRGHSTPALAAVLSTQWQNEQWNIGLSGNYIGRTRVWLPGMSCKETQRKQGRCRNPDQLLWNVHLARSLGKRVNLALDVHNLLDTQPVNYLSVSGELTAGLNDPLGRYFMLTLQLR